MGLKIGPPQAENFEYFKKPPLVCPKSETRGGGFLNLNTHDLRAPEELGKNPLTYGLFTKMIFCGFIFFETFCFFFEKSEVNIFLVPIGYEIMEVGLGNSFFSEKKCIVGSRKKTKKLESPKTLKTCSTGP